MTLIQIKVVATLTLEQTAADTHTAADLPAIHDRIGQVERTVHVCMSLLQNCHHLDFIQAVVDVAKHLRALPDGLGRLPWWWSLRSANHVPLL
jgi:hypothetical protein